MTLTYWYNSRRRCIYATLYEGDSICISATLDYVLRAIFERGYKVTEVIEKEATEW